MAGGSRPPPPPPPGTAITLINGDLNTQVTQPGPADHLSGGESSAAPTVNTDPSHARGWREQCVCACIWICVCVCVFAWVAFKVLMATFHCGHLVSSDNVTEVSSVLPTDTRVSYKHEGTRRSVSLI